MTSDKIRSHHLERKAILYVRQSSAHQVLHNRESGALQYAMRDRLAAKGWGEANGRSGLRSRGRMALVPLAAGGLAGRCATRGDHGIQQSRHSHRPLNDSVLWTRSGKFDLMQLERHCGFLAVPTLSRGADGAENEADLQPAVRTPNRVERRLGMGCAQGRVAICDSCPRRGTGEDWHGRAAQRCLCQAR